MLNCLLFIGCRWGVEDPLIGPKTGQRPSDLSLTADCVTPEAHMCLREENREREMIYLHFESVSPAASLSMLQNHILRQQNHFLMGLFPAKWKRMR